MLGTAVVNRLAGTGLEITATARTSSRFSNPAVNWQLFSAAGNELDELVRDLGEGDYVVNCIGLIKHRIDDSEINSRHEAILANSLLPYSIAQLAGKQGFQVVQIATDCVYDGTEGSYSEEASHNATDVYGKSKSLGEVPSPNILNIRCSIIGEETEDGPSLVGWLLSQPEGATISGYSDHYWNGVTTSAYANVVAGLIATSSKLAGTFHLVPSGSVDKGALSALILEVFGRTDIDIVPTSTGKPIDRTLATIHPEINQLLWTAGGYAAPPTIEAMVRSLVPLAP